MNNRHYRLTLKPESLWVLQVPIICGQNLSCFSVIFSLSKLGFTVRLICVTQKYRSANFKMAIFESFFLNNVYHILAY